MADDKKPEDSGFRFNPFTAPAPEPKPDPKPKPAPKTPPPPAPPAPDLNAANVGHDSQRPADNMVLDYDPLVDPGVKVAPATDPNTKDGVPGEDDDDEDDEPKPASLSMTKAELLDRLNESASGMTKAQILEQIQRVEDGESASDQPAGPSRAYDTATRSATLDGQTYTWTEESEGTVPDEVRLIWARSQQAPGGR